MQLVVTNACPYNCPFRIEKVNPTNNNERFYPTEQRETLKQLIVTLQDRGLEPTVSITGGEPTIYLDHILDVAEMLDELDTQYNLNTSGICTDEKLKAFERINLSVHNSKVSENDKIFGALRGRYWEDSIFQNATIQKVITNDNFE